MMTGRSRLFQLPVVVGLFLLLGACASQITSDGNQVSDVEVNRMSAHYAKSEGLRRLPPPHERGIENIAILYLPRSEVMFHAPTMWGFRKPRHVAHAKAVMPDFDFEEELLRQASKAPHVKLRFVTAEEARLAQHINYNKWLGTRSIDQAGLAMLADMRANGVDQVLFLQEPEILQNFLLGGRGYLPPKGFLGQPLVGTYVFAGFHFLLIDTATGEGIENNPYTQASNVTLEWRLRGPFEIHTAAEKEQMAAALRARMVNNIKYMLLLLKVVPAADGAFLTYDPDKPGEIRLPE